MNVFGGLAVWIRFRTISWDRGPVIHDDIRITYISSEMNTQTYHVQVYEGSDLFNTIFE